MIRIALSLFLNHVISDPILERAKSSKKVGKEFDKFYELLGDDAKIAKIVL